MWNESFGVLRKDTKMRNKKTDGNGQKRLSYRFALIGTTQTGKSCILAQLAQNRDGDAQGRFKSTLLRDKRSLTTEEEKQQKFDEKLRKVKNYQVGLERLDAVIQKLENGEKPDATNVIEENRLMLDFEMGSVERGDFVVAMEDYSGEHINLEHLNDPDSLTSLFNERFSKYDGLVFVVDTFQEEDDTFRAEQMVQALDGFFSTLKGKRVMELGSMPVALIFSRWDKYSEIDFNDPEGEFRKLEEFCALPRVAFCGQIIRSIRVAAASIQKEKTKMPEDPESQLTDGENEKDENYRIFPVSAFGKARKDGEDFVPVLGSKAFGIVEPFVWLANQCDQIQMLRMRKMAEELKALRGWNPLKWFCGRKTAGELLDLVKAQKNRIPTVHEEWHRELKEFQSLASKTQWKVFRTRFGVCLIGFFIAAAVALSWRMSVWQGKLNDPKVTVAQLEEVAWEVRGVDEFLTTLRLSRLPLLCNVSKIRQEISDRTEGASWSRVKKAAEGSQEQCALAKEYLKYHPLGTYVEEARKIVADYGSRIEEELWGEIQKRNAAEKIGPLEMYFKKVEAQEIPGTHKEEAEILREKLEMDGKWIKAFAVYQSAQTMEKASENVKKLMKDFGPERWGDVVKTDFPDRLCRQLDHANTNADPESCIQNCEQAAAIFKEAGEIAISYAQNDAMAVMTEEMRKVETQLKPVFIERLDRELYEEVRNGYGGECKKYLERMEKYGGGKMKDRVQKTAEFYERLVTPQTFTCTGTVSWGHGITKHYLRVEIFIDSKLCSTTQMDHADGAREGIKDFSFEKSPNQDVTIRVVGISERNKMFRNGLELHRGEKVCSIEKLSDGISFDIGTGSKIDLKLSGYPKKPEMPEWGK